MFTTTKKIAVLIMCSTVLVSCGSLEADRSSNFDIMPKAKLFATEHNEVVNIMMKDLSTTMVLV